MPMNADDMMKTEALCIEEHAPYCRAACPLHVDMRAVCGLLVGGEKAKAQAQFLLAAPLSRITARLCDAPCMEKCKRRELGGSVDIGAIERYLASDPEWTPPKVAVRFRSRHRVAIVGAGASGLSAAVYLAAKGFLVTVFERAASIGPALIGSRGLTEEDVQRDVAHFTELVEWKLSTCVGADIAWDELFASFDAVLATGGRPAHIPGEPDALTLRVADSKLFLAGRKLLSTPSFVSSLCAGKRAAIGMERLAKGISLTAMRVNEDAYETGLITPTDGVGPVPAVPEPEDGYSDADAKVEAARCMQCRCMICVRECAFLQKFDKYPRLYIREIANTISLLRDGVRSGKNLLVACSMCGLCGRLCPNGIPMDRVVHDGRAAMADKGDLSEAIYDFPVRDMLFSNSDEAALCRNAPGRERSLFAFFPGCQLAASLPELVPKTYAHLLSLEPETGIVLGCCGAPADWAGRSALYAETVAGIRGKLERLGNPTLIASCPTCVKQLKAEGVPVISLYAFLAERALPEAARRPRRVAVHDSCTARGEADTLDGVRKLLSRCGYEIEELAMSRDKTRCCGYGGLVFYGDRDVANRMIEARAAESGLPFVSYCSVCRDYLRRAGKPGVHVLNVLFGEDGAADYERRGASISEKNANRLRAAAGVLRLYGETPKAFPADEGPALVIPEDVRALLEDRLITEQTIRRVIAEAESTGRRLVRPADGHLFASLRPGIVTYWVEYQKRGGGYEVFNAYSHRVDISEASV